ncbi:MAG: hypothetical protein S4CHLAM6_03120 [Chlamydiae bacterium]|nr:hypothetical protein [Chlamydiota bacterium]
MSQSAAINPHVMSQAASQHQESPSSKKKASRSSSVSGAHHTSRSKSHSKASESDHAMFLGMMSLLEGMGESEDIGVSLARMSKTLYDTLIKNGTGSIQNMQKELSDLSFLQKNWAAFSAYTGWSDALSAAHQLEKSKNPAERMAGKLEVEQLSGHPPAIPSGCTTTMINGCVGLVHKFKTLSHYRSYVNAFSQKINTANTEVESNKQIPDSLQAQVRLMLNDQSQYASEFTSFLRVMQDQLQFS